MCLVLVLLRHFTLSRSEKGPDSEFSLEPEELRTLCEESKASWISLGKAGYDRKPAEMPNLVFRRSLYVTQDVEQGAIFTKENVRSIRPGYGLLPKHIDSVLGKRATCNIERGTALSWDLLELE